MPVTSSLSQIQIDAVASVSSTTGRIVVDEGPSVFFTGGGTQAATGTATALNSGTSLACSEVYVQNDPGSANNLYIGSAAAQPLVLTPGIGMSLQAANVNLMYVKVTGTAQANWLARA